MKKMLIILLFTIGSLAPALSQKARDVIENGIKIKDGNEIFIKFDGSNILYQQNTLPNDLRFKQIEDSIMLLPVDGTVLVFMRPLNPLNFSYKVENKEIIDPIDAAAATALKSIIDFFKKAGTEDFEEGKFCPDMTRAVDRYKKIFNLLSKDQREIIKTTFNHLKSLDFVSQASTEKAVDKAGDTIGRIADHFNTIQDEIVQLKKDVAKIDCEDENKDFIVNQVFVTAIKDLDVTYSTQRKRLTNLEKVFNLVKNVQQEASANNWLIKLYEVPAAKGKISLFSIKVSESGYKLSAEGEIIESPTNEKAARVFRVRRFQRFVPEASAGMAYVNLSFPKFGANSDGNGKNLVANAGEEKINKVNFTTMLNYTMFLTNSPLHPFWQIGIGVNTDFPTFLTGIGLRLNAAGLQRLAVSSGIATSWIKNLDKLKVGDQVAGQADVEKDLKYKLNTPKLYFGIQYNF